VSLGGQQNLVSDSANVTSFQVCEPAAGKAWLPEALICSYSSQWFLSCVLDSCSGSAVIFVRELWVCDGGMM